MQDFLESFMAEKGLVAALDPQDELLLRALRRGEIGPINDPNIQKAISDLEKMKYTQRGRV